MNHDTDDRVKRITVDGMDWAYLEQGAGSHQPLVICLHGFPDSAYSFQQTQAALAAKGYRVIAPFLPGYAPSGLTPDDDYAIPSLARRLLALIDALGEEQVIVIGHDWGGFIAYTAAILAPDKFASLVVLGIPHTGGSKPTWEQLRKSWYILFFQLPRWPERAVPKNNFRFIENLYRDWSPNWPRDAWQLQPVKEALAAPENLRAALGYYRQMFRATTRADQALMKQPVTVPTLWIGGEVDGAIDADQFENTHRVLTGRNKVRVLPGVGHFIHREAAELFQQELLLFLQA